MRWLGRFLANTASTGLEALWPKHVQPEVDAAEALCRREAEEEVAKPAAETRWLVSADDLLDLWNPLAEMVSDHVNEWLNGLAVAVAVGWSATAGVGGTTDMAPTPSPEGGEVVPPPDPPSGHSRFFSDEVGRGGPW